MASFSRAFQRFSASFSPRTTEIKKTSAKITKQLSATSFSFNNAFKTVAARQPNSSISKSIFSRVHEVKPQLPQLQVSPRTDYKLNVSNLVQNSNGCGPTSLAMIMQYLGVNPGNYHNMFESDTVGHGPLALKQKVRNKGLTVRQENYGSLSDLAALVDKGIPVMTLGIYGGGSNSSISNYIDNAKRAHWMVVTGYKKNDSG
ncbi:MAG: C39 family peptidase [Candidatus Saganbacteria bacterium]|nr:C39 family peptidase [Candidatus Saganbacteria bacterium]